VLFPYLVSFIRLRLQFSVEHIYVNIILDARDIEL